MIWRDEKVVEFTKLNGESFLINPYLIEFIELIPESKIIMVNGHFHIVKEDKSDIIRKVTEYRKEVCQGAGPEVI